MIISTPVIWPIHNFPGDYLRLLPDWYVMFAHRNNLILKPETFCWLTQFGIIPIEDHMVEGIYQIPNFLAWAGRNLHRNIGLHEPSKSYLIPMVGRIHYPCCCWSSFHSTWIMCGICGSVGYADGEDLVQKMTRAMLHRGPDSEGCLSWDSSTWGCAGSKSLT